MFKESSVKFNNKKGFTLAELLTVLGITVILLAIGMIAILHYSNILKLTQMDNTSKEIFIAAQNHLTQAEADGTLDKVIKDSNNDSSLLGSKMTAKPSDMSSDEWEKNGDNYYFCVYNSNPNDMTTTSDSLNKGMMKLLLPYGSIDNDVRSDGHYVIEYNIKTATVYGVFYNDGKLLSSSDEGVGIYFNTTAGVRPVNNTSAALEAAKDKRMSYTSAANPSVHFVIGYYGGAMINLKGTDIKAPEVKVDNADKLTVTVTDPNYYNQFEDNKLMTYINLKVKGNDSGVTETLRLTLDNSKLDGTKTAKNDISNDPDNNSNYYESWSAKPDTGNPNTAKAMVYTINLDDITKYGGHFAEVCRSLTPGEDITITAECSSNSVITQVQDSKPVETNSLFADVKSNYTTESAKTESGLAEIACIRHLENLDPRISNLPVKTGVAPDYYLKSQTKNTYSIDSALQTKNIDYNDFVNSVGKSFSIYENMAFQCNTGNNAESSREYNVTKGREIERILAGSYYGIYNFNLNYYNGNNKCISNIIVNNETNTEDSTLFGDSNGGMFREVCCNFTARDLTLKGFNVSAYKNAAAFISEIQNDSKSSTGITVYSVNLSRILVLDGNMASTGSKSGNAGGLIGYCKTNGNSNADGALYVNSCVATAKCKSTNNAAGGLIAKIGGPAYIYDSYSGGHTKSGKYDTSNYNIEGTSANTDIIGTGGFIGAVQNVKKIIISNCYSSCSAKGYYAGGFIGYNYVNNSNNAEIKNSYSVGLVSGTKQGPFVGRAGSCTWTSDYYIGNINGTLSDDKATVCQPGDKSNTVVFGSDANSKTFPFDTTLNTYPFRMVNNTVSPSDDGGYSAVHYGDWQQPKANLKNTNNMLAYREKNSDGSYSWSILGASVNSSGNVDVSTVYDNLITDKSNYVSDTSYGLLIGSNESLSNYFNSMSYIKTRFDVSNPEDVVIGDSHYNYYKLNSTYSSANFILNLPAWYLTTSKSPSSPKVYFDLNPMFAAAMCKHRVEEMEMGTSSDPYQVRTQTQFENIGYSDKYRGLVYKQTSDMSFSGIYSKSPIYYFTGKYDAAKDAEVNYSIENLNITSYSTSPIALFGWYNSGTISGIDLSGGTINCYDGTYSACITGTNIGSIKKCKVMNMSINATQYNTSVGGIVAVNGTDANPGVLSNCVVTGCKLDISSDSCYYAGGAVGRNYNGTIENCSAVGEIDVNTPGAENTGGLVGRNDSTVAGCSAAVTMSITSTTLPSDKFIGGLIGYNVPNETDNTKLENCNSGGSIEFTYTKSDIPSYLDIGGMIGYTDPSYSSLEHGYEYKKCHARTDLNVIFNNSYGSSANIRHCNIGGFIGYVPGNYLFTDCSAKCNISSSASYCSIGGFTAYCETLSYNNTNYYPEINYCWAKTNIFNKNENASIGGLIACMWGVSPYGSIANDYATTYFTSGTKGTIGTFVGNEYESGTSYRNYDACYGVERVNSTDNTIKQSSYPLTNNTLNSNELELLFICYDCSTDRSIITGSINHLSVEQFRSLSNFSNLDNDYWETKNDNYPTLVNNPEP